MSSTHLSLNYHVVFSTKDRQPSIRTEWQSDLYAYIGGIVRDMGGAIQSIGGITDHVHILLGLRATHRLADVVGDIKSGSSRWLHTCGLSRRFDWQDGYGGFTVSASRVAAVKNYIEHQAEHHRRRSFQEEYLALLEDAGVEFDRAYLW